MTTQKEILDALKTLKPIHKRNSTNLKCGNNSILINRNQQAREKLQKNRGISDEELISEMSRLNINN